MNQKIQFTSLDASLSSVLNSKVFLESSASRSLTAEEVKSKLEEECKCKVHYYQEQSGNYIFKKAIFG
jgi:ABC-type thiamine transport system substrate-binding protein